MIRLELERRKRGLSQEGLARDLLYRGERISWLENQKPNVSNINPRLRKTLEDYFGLSLETLMKSID